MIPMRLAPTLTRYFALRFLAAVAMVFGVIFALMALIDYVEMMRRASSIANVSVLLVAKTSFYRVPQLVERIIPFSVLIAAMISYLGLSRRHELVIARSAGMSAWQFITPALGAAFVLGIFATTVYNPISALLDEKSKLYESELFGTAPIGGSGGTFWATQKSEGKLAIINAKSSSDQGVSLSGVTIYTYDEANHFQLRIEARSAALEPGQWRILDARIYEVGALPVEVPVYILKTSLTRAQVRENFATPETVPFWQLPSYIETAEHAGLVASGYRLQLQKLLARPFMLAAMIFLAAAVSLRFFRFGGVQKMVLSGVAAGFLLYVLGKVTEDLSKAQLMNPITAVWLPIFGGGLTGLIALLYQEDG
jgi:lipopolysaccharide export system permease protein